MHYNSLHDRTRTSKYWLELLFSKMYFITHGVRSSYTKTSVEVHIISIPKELVSCSILTYKWSSAALSFITWWTSGCRIKKKKKRTNAWSSWSTKLSCFFLFPRTFFQKFIHAFFMPFRMWQNIHMTYRNSSVNRASHPTCVWWVPSQLWLKMAHHPNEHCQCIEQQQRMSVSESSYNHYHCQH